MHLHQSVVDAGGRNIFSQPDGSEDPRFRQFIAGMQTHLPDLMLMLAPNVNSYRRFVKGSQAPIHLQWGYDNRTAGLRVPVSGPAARRVEMRVAGADANPYLAIAASLAAGLAGIDEALVATEPLSGDGYAQDHALPRTPHEALERMAGSETARRLFGDDFVTAYVAVKEMEFADYDREISAWERRILLPMV
jgi:glutamine synthetase